MSKPSRVKILRAFRAGLAIYFACILVLDAADWIAFSRVVIWEPAVLVFTASVLGFLAFVINRDRQLGRPRPDYSAIAAMEREVYGETFEHDGAPQRTEAVPPTMPPAGPPPSSRPSPSSSPSPRSSSPGIHASVGKNHMITAPSPPSSPP